MEDGSTGPGLPVVVGREDEVRVLDDALARAREGGACAVLVRGEAGIGKTTLVREAVARTERSGGTVLWAPCLRFGAIESTFLPFVLALERWRRDADEDQVITRVPGVSALLPSLGAAPGPGPLGLLPVVSAVLDALANVRPVLLVVDDVQWADAATLDALAYVLAGLGGQRLCVVVTCRDEGLAPDDPVRGWWADVRRHPAVTECALRRLSPEDTEQQLTGVLGPLVAPALAAEVHARSRGNPYLSELLVRHVGPTDETLPSGMADELSEALLRVWHELGDDGRRLTQVLAVAGRPVGLDTLLEVVHDAGGAPSTTEVVSDAVARGVVVRQGTELWFRHPLLADILLATVPTDEERRWHALWADRFERLAATGIEELRRLAALGLHREGAGDLSGAARASLAAADVAHGLRARREEALHLRRATRLWPRIAGDISDLPDQVDVMMRAVSTSRLVGADEGALALVERCLEMVDVSTDPLRASWLVRNHDDLRWELGMAPDRLVVEGRRAAFALSGAQPDSEEHALALADLAMSLSWTADPEAVGAAEQAVEAASRAGTAYALADALAARAMVRLNTDDPGASADSLRQLELAAGVDDPDLRGWAAIWRSNVLSAEGRLEEDLELLSRARTDMIAEGAVALVAYLECSMAKTLLLLGRLREAADVLHHALSLGGLPNYAAAVRLAAAQLAARTGRPEAAVAHLTRTAELVPSYELRPGLEAPPVCAEILVSQGRPDEALAVLRRTATAQSVDSRVLDVMAVWAATAAADLAARARDDGDAARAGAVDAELDELLGPATALGGSRSRAAFVPTGPVDMVAPAWRALFEAERSRCTDDPDEAVAWRAAIEACDSAGLRWDAARARLRLAVCSVRAARRPTGLADLLREVVRYADAEGAVPLRTEAVRLARVGRVSLDEPALVPEQRRRGALAGLTPREHEVLSHLVAGRTYAEVAAALTVSEKTVSSHVSHLLRKTGTSSRVELAALADRLADR